jgi:hypothetical protein
MTQKETSFIRVAQAEDTYNLLNHIAWTDVILPKLERKKAIYSKMIVDHHLGKPIPQDLTVEQIAGKVYGIEEIISLFAQILSQGEKALADINYAGIQIA